MNKKFISLYNSAKIIKIDRDFPKLWSQMYCHLFLWFTVYIVRGRILMFIFLSELCENKIGVFFCIGTTGEKNKLLSYLRSVNRG